MAPCSVTSITCRRFGRPKTVPSNGAAFPANWRIMLNVLIPHEGEPVMGPTARFMLSIVGSAAYLSLAVLGWGGFAAFFSHPALIALAVVLGVIAGAAFFAGGNLSPGLREDRGNRWVLAAFGVIGVLGAWLPAYADRNEFWIIDGDAVRWL